MSENRIETKESEVLKDSDLDEVNGGVDLRNLVYRPGEGETLNTLEYRGEEAVLSTLEQRGLAGVFTTLERKKKNKKKTTAQSDSHLINL